MRLKILLFILPSLFLVPFKGYGQDNNEDQSYTPYELLSSYYSNDFKPFKKSNFYLGLAFSVEDKYMENTSYLIKQVVEGNRTNFNVKLKGGYYIGDYTMAGINVSYFQNKFNGDVFSSPDTVQSNAITRGFTITPNIRPSFPLTANERLSFFTEIGLTYGLNTTLTRDIKYEDEITKTYETVNNFKVGISPGITFFAMENFAFEVQLNVLGYSMEISEKTINDVETSRQVRHNVDFKLSLLTLDMGLAYYFGAGSKVKQ
mgnify:CR=1 FL=1